MEHYHNLYNLVPYQYTGKYRESISGLNQMDALWYNPKVGRFIQPDQYNHANLMLPKGAQSELMRYIGRTQNDLLKDPAQQMRYGYVSGNALRWVDPLGLVTRQDLQKRAYEIAAEVESNGGFQGKGEADWIYQLNSDPDLEITVDASNLTVKTNGKWTEIPNDGGWRAPAYVTGDDYAVHGQGTVRYRPDGTYGFYDQKYDYELHFDPTLKGIARDLGTFFGKPPAGWPNTPFGIHYEGNVNIVDPFECTNND